MRRGVSCRDWSGEAAILFRRSQRLGVEAVSSVFSMINNPVMYQGHMDI